MNPVIVARATIAGVRLGRSIAAHRKQMKKLREEKQFWIDLKENIDAANAQPTVIHVQCERLA
jgi:uncharacterized protein (DUF2252 family)